MKTAMSALTLALMISPLTHAAKAPVRIGLEQVKIPITRIYTSSAFTFSHWLTASPFRMLSLTGGTARFRRCPPSTQAASLSR